MQARNSALQLETGLVVQNTMHCRQRLCAALFHPTQIGHPGVSVQCECCAAHDFLTYCLAMCVSAADILRSGKEGVMLVICGNEYTLSRHAAKSASKLAAGWMKHDGKMGMDRESMGLAAGVPVYLETEEKRRTEWWKAVLGRVLQSTCAGFWRRIRLACYLRLAEKNSAAVLQEHGRGGGRYPGGRDYGGDRQWTGCMLAWQERCLHRTK